MLETHGFRQTLIGTMALTDACCGKSSPVGDSVWMLKSEVMLIQTQFLLIVNVHNFRGAISLYLLGSYNISWPIKFDKSP